MRRSLALAALAVAVIALVTVAVATGGSGGRGYRIRAIFDSAANVIPGEDVKIAGARVGAVDSLDLTAQRKAVVVLDITNPGFQDFRTDASCTIRPQSLIGEKFVECSPTQPRAIGAPLPPALAVVPSGRPGAGERLLPVADTSSPVDLDLVGDTMRLPFRQRLTILINELGAGLAGRGEDLRAVIRRADPALAQTDRVLAELAGENRTLADLATQSDAALAPLARDRAQVADSIVQGGVVAQASAERAGALRRNLADLPAFLRQLEPTMARIGQLADQTTPVLSNLDAAAPALDRATAQLGPFARAATPFFQTLGHTAQTGTPAVRAIAPLLGTLQALGAKATPFSANLAALLSSAQRSGGIEYLMDFIFLGAAATNGYDTLGHYLRATLVVNNCSTYATAPTAGCNADFVKPVAAGAARASTARTIGRAQANGRRAPGAGPSVAAPPAAPAAGATPALEGRTARAPAAGSPQGPSARLLNYLLGG